MKWKTNLPVAFQDLREMREIRENMIYKRGQMRNDMTINGLVCKKYLKEKLG